MNFSQWFHETYEITEEPQIIPLRQMIYSYKSYCILFYKTKTEHDKNTTYPIFLNKMKQYEPEIYDKYFNQQNVIYNSIFCNIRRKDGWGKECNRCENTGYDESGNCLGCNL
jgi:hypothetical protein